MFSTRAISLVLASALGGCAMVGAFGSESVGREFFSWWVFRAVVVLLAVALVVSLAGRIISKPGPRVIGSILLHASIVLLIFGSIYNGVMGWERTCRIIEGESRSLQFGSFALELNKLHPVYRRDGWDKGDAAEVTVHRSGRPERDEIVHVNRPLLLAGSRIYLEDFGFAPRLDVIDDVADNDFRGFVAMEAGGGPHRQYWNVFHVAGTALDAHAVFRPARSGVVPAGPSMKVVLRDGGGRKVFAGEVSQRGMVDAGGYRVSLGPVRYWATFQIRHDPGLGLIFASFWIAIAGACIALVPRIVSGHV